LHWRPFGFLGHHRHERHALRLGCCLRHLGLAFRRSRRGCWPLRRALGRGELRWRLVLVVPLIGDSAAEREHAQRETEVDEGRASRAVGKRHRLAIAGGEPAGIGRLEALGLTVSEVAHQLKLAPRQVEALEAGRFDALPGPTFLRGMLRNYARLVKLDPDTLLEQIAGRFEAPDAGRLAARYSQPVPFSDSARRSTFVYLGLSLGVLALGGGIAYQWYHEHKAPTQVAAAKRPAQKPAAAPAAPRSEPKVAQEASSEPQRVALVPVVPQEPERPPVQPPQVQKVAVAPVLAAAPPKARPSGGLNRLVIRCEEEAWIEVKDANDRMLVSSLNPKGSERIVRARGPLTLVIGNAQHVHVLHNDKPVDLAPHTKLAIARFTLP